MYLEAEYDNADCNQTFSWNHFTINCAAILSARVGKRPANCWVALTPLKMHMADLREDDAVNLVNVKIGRTATKRLVYSLLVLILDLAALRWQCTKECKTSAQNSL